MRLTLQSDYALRMLMSLSIRGGAMTVQEIASQYGVSRNHLLKVALRLRKCGYLTTGRGRAGGVALACAPSEIGIGAVLRAMEGDFHLVECFRPDAAACVLNPACRLKPIVHEALEAFLAVFDRYTLADLVADGPALGALFHPAAGGSGTSLFRSNALVRARASL